MLKHDISEDYGQLFGPSIAEQRVAVINYRDQCLDPTKVYSPFRYSSRLRLMWRLKCGFCRVIFTVCPETQRNCFQFGSMLILICPGCWRQMYNDIH